MDGDKFYKGFIDGMKDFRMSPLPFSEDTGDFIAEYVKEIFFYEEPEARKQLPFKWHDLEVREGNTIPNDYCTIIHYSEGIVVLKQALETKFVVLLLPAGELLHIRRYCKIDCEFRESVYLENVMLDQQIRMCPYKTIFVIGDNAIVTSNPICVRDEITFNGPGRLTLMNIGYSQPVIGPTTFILKGKGPLKCETPLKKITLSGVIVKCMSDEVEFQLGGFEQETPVEVVGTGLWSVDLEEKVKQVSLSFNTPRTKRWIEEILGIQFDGMFSAVEQMDLVAKNDAEMLGLVIDKWLETNPDEVEDFLQNVNKVVCEKASIKFDTRSTLVVSSVQVKFEEGHHASDCFKFIQYKGDRCVISSCFSQPYMHNNAFKVLVLDGPKLIQDRIEGV